MRIQTPATQIRVTNLERALRFYVDLLGFEEDFRFRDFYAGMRGGGASLHLKRVEATDPRSTTCGKATMPTCTSG